MSNLMNKEIDYSIHKYSSYSANYYPQNIKEKRSKDQSSRWTSDSNNPPQFITLKLHKPAIVRHIQFGKYEQTHVCNLKKFQVYGGLDKKNMMLLLEDGLKNDNIPEIFPLRHTLHNQEFAVKYIKIVPLLSWGSSFNFTIWFVSLFGTDDSDIVESAIKFYYQHKEKEIVRLCLKHFRDMNYTNAMKSLEEQTGIQLENTYVTQLHKILVQQANYEQAENFIQQAAYEGYFKNYIEQQNYKAIWTSLTPFSNDNSDRPGMRGGHQMCIDPYTETIYLMGGWDGYQDLSDLWSYSIATGKWALLCRNSELEGGPTPRSCHKICLDWKRKQIFTLGRYLEVFSRTTETVKSDFYMYDIENGKWTQISADTSVTGGPSLIHDHQICIDVEKRTLYIFGGRVLTYTSDNSNNTQTDIQFSGLYSYEVSTDTWTLLSDCARTQPMISNSNVLSAARVSRIGHAMLFHSGNNKLYIFGGQHNKDYLDDFFTYDVVKREFNLELYRGDGENGKNSPPPGYTLRATIDPDLNEIYVLSGLSRDKRENIQNSLWIYSIIDKKWRCIYKNENGDESYWQKMQHLEPCPRYAHQLVYNNIKKVHYLFGGNPSRGTNNQRLDDFWKLTLNKPDISEIIQECRFLIRRYYYREKTVVDPVAALQYLQTSLYEIIDPNDKKRMREFQLLPSELFCEKIVTAAEDDDESDFRHRTKIDKAIKMSTNELTGNLEKSNYDDEKMIFECETDVKNFDNNSHDSEHSSIECTGTSQQEMYLARTNLFEKLMVYFPEEMRQPKGNLSDYIVL